MMEMEKVVKLLRDTLKTSIEVANDPLERPFSSTSQWILSTSTFVGGGLGD